jgi:phospholipid/cholesterol/gamma-HCH transport system substrate-binding protein
MGKTLVENILSAAVLAVAAGFLWFSYTSANVAAVRGYEVTANFFSIAGLGAGADVKMSGIKIGTVTRMSIEPNIFDAKIVLSIDPAIKLPTDSSARISSDGLLGGNYLDIIPGQEKSFIPVGGAIAQTESPKDLIQEIGAYIFGPQQQ